MASSTFASLWQARIGECTRVWHKLVSAAFWASLPRRGSEAEKIKGLGAGAAKLGKRGCWLSTKTYTPCHVRRI
eukprot:jgi/Botrbrau1/10342/Bobra.0321s0017.1